MRTRVDDRIHNDDEIVRSDARRTTRTSLIAILVIGLSLLGVVTAPVSGAAISTGRAKVQFIQDEFVQYNAIGTFVGNLQKLPKTPTEAQVRAVAKPLGRSIEAFQSSVQKQSWPTKAQSEVQNLSTASSTTSTGLLEKVTNATSLTTGAVNDINSWIRQVNIMNSDLGLPAFTNLRFVDACQADGAVVTTAMAAFRAETHGKTPTIVAVDREEGRRTVPRKLAPQQTALHVHAQRVGRPLPCRPVGREADPLSRPQRVLFVLRVSRRT